MSIINNTLENPAEVAATESLKNVFWAIENEKNFRFEAGAGAGKTYSLIKALKHLIKLKGISLAKLNQQIACITYTNVAKDEIRSRTDNNSLVFAETIHTFCWNLIKEFQNTMLKFIPELGEKWKIRVETAGDISRKKIVYNLGYPKISDETIFLHHDDVIKLMTDLLNLSKFRNIVKSRFPIIFIDEYQDTNKILIEAFHKHFIIPEKGPLLGFFGDHWQQIYGSSSCGLIDSSEGKLMVIGKKANFRSDRKIVEALNKMRPELIQHEYDNTSNGEINIFHSNNWVGIRRKDNHWQEDLPAEDANLFFDASINKLKLNGWEFTPSQTKILMLTNSLLAEKQGYKGIINAFPNSDDYLKKNNEYISFLIDTVEQGCLFYEQGKYGEMFRVFNIKAIKIKTIKDKELWREDMDSLLEKRNSGTVGEVIDLLKRTHKPRLTAKLEQKEEEYHQLILKSEDDRTEDEFSFINLVSGIRNLPYSELITFSKFIEDKTPFSTKHGVKGEEYNNVLVVCGRGWNNYNWNQMLEWAGSQVPNGKQDTFTRNRNLFYVACSRPKRKLAILFTQKLSDLAINTLGRWFGPENISPLEI